MKSAQILAALAVATVALGFSPPAFAAASVTNVSKDTVTELDIDWTFFAADSSLQGSWTGVHWEAWLTPTFAAGTWTVDAWYQHRDGPHGEGAESPSHYLGQVSFAPGTGGLTPMSGQDHNPPDFHALAHSGFLAANGPGFGGGGVPPGFARTYVTHVPEPGEWLMLAAGLALLGARRARRG